MFNPDFYPTPPEVQLFINTPFTPMTQDINGDPDYADSWHDIAGYAQLVADRLNGVQP